MPDKDFMGIALEIIKGKENGVYSFNILTMYNILGKNSPVFSDEVFTPNKTLFELII